MPLGLHEASHDPKGTKQIPVGVCGQPRNDCVIWALAGGQAVGVPLLQDEAVAPILEAEPAAIWHDACSAESCLWQEDSPCGGCSVRCAKPRCTWGFATKQEVVQGFWRLRTQLTCPKTHVVAVDEAAGIALSIDNTEVHRVSTCPLWVVGQAGVRLPWLQLGCLHNVARSSQRRQISSCGHMSNMCRHVCRWFVRLVSCRHMSSQCRHVGGQCRHVGR